MFWVVDLARLRRFSGLICVFAMFAWIDAAHAEIPAAVGDIPATLADLLHAAAVRDSAQNNQSDPDYLTRATILAIDIEPEKAPAILAFAVTLIPENREIFLDEIAAAFAARKVPGLGAALRALQMPVMAIVSQPSGSQLSALPPHDNTHSQTAAMTSFLERVGLSGNIELGATSTSGNTDETTLNTALNAKLKRNRWRHELGLNFDWTEAEGDTTKRRFLGYYQLDYDLTERIFLFGYLEYEDDRFSGFDYRVSENFGAGYQIVNQEKLLWSLQGGPAFRQTRVAGSGQTTSDIGARVNSSLTWAVSDSTLLGQETSYTIDNQRSTVNTVTSAKIKINSALSGKLSFEVQWDSDVPAGSEKTDTITRAALVYDF